MRGWQIRKVKADHRSRRDYIWEVTCPATPPEPSWDNDFLRGYQCGCRHFKTEGKATRYIERMKADR